MMARTPRLHLILFVVVNVGAVAALLIVGLR